MTSDEAKAQREQLERFNAWAASEGTMELPVQLSTYMRPEQERRIQWLKDRVSARLRAASVQERIGLFAGGDTYRVVDQAVRLGDMVTVLEIGCSWGYVLAEIGASDVFRGGSRYRPVLVGVDVNPQLVQLARFLNRAPGFWVADARNLSGIDAADIVMLPEVLEHVEMDDVAVVLAEAFRTARLQVLVTLPLAEHAAENAKHRWRSDLDPWWAINEFGRIAKIWDHHVVRIEIDDEWLLMDAWKTD